MVDEASMLDLPTMYRIDPGQFSPIQFGLVLHALVERPEIPFVVLTLSPGRGDRHSRGRRRDPVRPVARPSGSRRRHQRRGRPDPIRRGHHRPDRRRDRAPRRLCGGPTNRLHREGGRRRHRCVERALSRHLPTRLLAEGEPASRTTINWACATAASAASPALGTRR